MFVNYVCLHVRSSTFVATFAMKGKYRISLHQHLQCVRVYVCVCACMCVYRVCRVRECVCF